MKDQELYDYSPITERPPLEWPDGKKVAFYIGYNVEHFYLDVPSTSLVPFTSELQPDPLNYGWRDYGPRVGFWRLARIFDRHGVRPSVLLNSDVVDYYPQIIEAAAQRNWPFLAHGKTNSALNTGVDAETERQYLTEVVEKIEQGTGQRPKGWMGPGLAETYETPRLLTELGLRYTLGWTNDDQPYAWNQPGFYSVPYTVELNDIGIFVFKSHTGEEFLQMLKDQLDQLVLDAEDGGRVFPIALHPFVIGQAFRAGYLDKALDYITNHEAVWVTTSDDIVEHFAKTTAGTAAAAGTSA